MTDFNYQKAYPLQGDNTKYRKISSKYVSTVKFEGEDILKIDSKALEILAEEAMADVGFYFNLPLRESRQNFRRPRIN
jgi:fumarate hydratase class I